MPDVVTKVKPTFGANVSNRSTSAPPSVGQPTGPQGFPPPPVPPVPPKSQIESAAASEVGGEYILTITFSDEVVGFNPFGAEQYGWTLTAGGTPIEAFFVDPPQTASVQWLISGPVPPFVVTVLPGAVGMFNAQGGSIEPGVFPVTIV